MQLKPAAVICGVAALLLVLFAPPPVPRGDRTKHASAKENGMARSIRAAGGRDARPAIDRTGPARTETATFALG